MNYIFYGIYWTFCLVRAVMTASFGHVNYGAFQNGEGLVLGALGTVAWFMIVFSTLAVLGEVGESIPERGKKK